LEPEQVGKVSRKKRIQNDAPHGESLNNVISPFRTVAKALASSTRLGVSSPLKGSVSTPTPAPEEKEPEPISEKAQEEISRFVNTWNSVCKKCDRSKLVWRSSEVDRYAKDLQDIIEVCEIGNISDDALESRLRLLCKSLNEVSEYLSDARQYNRNGLQLRSYVLYGQHLWAELERIEAEQIIKKKKTIQITADEVPNIPPRCNRKEPICFSPHL
jgi:hypothetical protein